MTDSGVQVRGIVLQGKGFFFPPTYSSTWIHLTAVFHGLTNPQREFQLKIAAKSTNVSKRWQCNLTSCSFGNAEKQQMQISKVANHWAI